MMLKNRQISIFGLGNPLMDIITYIEDDFVSDRGIKLQTMNLIDEEKFKKYFSELTDYTLMAGGSCANTLRGFTFLNAQNELPAPLFMGAVGKDELGDHYIRTIENAGVISGIIKKQSHTGASLILVTPDLERTMLTSLGACRTITITDIDLTMVTDAGILHITGYQWDTANQKKLVKELVETAKKNDVLISFDLADPFVVSRYRDDFLSWIPNHVDVLFGNYDEYALLTGVHNDCASVITAAKSMADIVLMKIGKDGSYCYADNKLLYSKGFTVEAVDTTGAGDAYAGGFLYGLLKQFTLEKCCTCANKLASQIVTIQGCDYNQLSY
jgi:sugar/nucleoside kinase (ribokinase family)